MVLLREVRRHIRWGLWGLRNPRVARVIDRVVQERLTYLDPLALKDLADVVLRNEARSIPGVVVECGCALGGSAITLAAAKRSQRPLLAFDVFGMIPPPSDKDGPDVHQRYDKIASGASRGIDDDQYYGYVENLYDKVMEAFARLEYPCASHAVRLTKGLFQDTLHVAERIALAHIDCDWYESVRTCLERLEPKLVPGGTLVIDDYHCWSGCRTAVDEYFAKKPTSHYRFYQKSRLHIVKR